MLDNIEYSAIIEVNDVKDVLEKHNIDESLQQVILADLSATAEKYADIIKDNMKPEEQLSDNKNNEKNNEPKTKKDYIILLSDPSEKIKDEYLGWSFQIDEDQNPGELVDKIKMTASDFNNSKKGQKIPVNTIGETIQNVPVKFFKEHKIYPKHKEPVYICITNNKLY